MLYKKKLKSQKKAKILPYTIYFDLLNVFVFLHQKPSFFFIRQFCLFLSLVYMIFSTAFNPPKRNLSSIYVPGAHELKALSSRRDRETDERFLDNNMTDLTSLQRRLAIRQKAEGGRFSYIFYSTSHMLSYFSREQSG